MKYEVKKNNLTCTFKRIVAGVRRERRGEEEPGDSV